MSMPKLLADALERARSASGGSGGNVIHSSAILRADRELLLRAGWIRKIIKGWYLLTKPEAPPGESTQWYASYWDFLGAYLSRRFGMEYCLSAAASLDRHIDNPLVPRQVTVMVPKGGGAPLDLPFDTSLLMYNDPKNIPADRSIIQGLQVMTLPRALVKIPETYYPNHAQNAEIALKMVGDPGEIARALILTESRTAAARIIGAYEFLKLDRSANELRKALEIPFGKIVAKNPFSEGMPLLGPSRIKAPVAARIEAMWQTAHSTVEIHEKKSVECEFNKNDLLAIVDESYRRDAFHSLSIEGYQVTEDLIKKVRDGDWDPDSDPEDGKQRERLAAAGYKDAFRHVRASLAEVFNGGEAVSVLQAQYQTWYRLLFGYFVRAGVYSADSLVGYRNGPVFIRDSRHCPPRADSISDAMDALFTCLSKEPSAMVKAILAHYFFVYIHPYPDGNGRMARFAMNFLMVAAGRPWTIIRSERRKEYREALATMDTKQDISFFADFILEEMRESTV